MNWGDWPELYSNYIPDVILQYEDYDPEDFADCMDEKTFYLIKALYYGITCGRDDDPADTVNSILNLPHEMAMIYEGTTIGDGHESLNIIEHAEKILISHNIELPDYTKVLFSKSSERNGWGNNFDGSYLSIIL